MPSAEAVAEFNARIRPRITGAPRHIEKHWFDAPTFSDHLEHWDMIAKSAVPLGDDVLERSRFRDKPGYAMWDFIVTSGVPPIRGDLEASRERMLIPVTSQLQGSPKTATGTLITETTPQFKPGPEFELMVANLHEKFHGKDMPGRLRRQSFNPFWREICMTAPLFYSALAERVFRRSYNLPDSCSLKHIRISWCTEFNVQGRAPVMFSSAINGTAPSKIPLDRSLIEVLVVINTGHAPLSITNPGQFRGDNDYQAYRPVGAAIAGWCPASWLYLNRLALNRTPLNPGWICFAVAANDLIRPELLQRKFILDVAGIEDPGDASIDEPMSTPYQYPFPCLPCLMFGGDAVAPGVPNPPWFAPKSEAKMTPMHAEFEKDAKFAIKKIRESLRYGKR